MASGGAIARVRENFRRLCFEQSRTPSNVARKAGLSPSWATNLKKGTSSVSLMSLDAIAKELRVDVSELLAVSRRELTRQTLPAPSMPSGRSEATSPPALVQ